MLQRATILFIACLTSISMVNFAPSAAGISTAPAISQSDKSKALTALALTATAAPNVDTSPLANQGRDRIWWTLIVLSVVLVLSSTTLLAFSVGQRFSKRDTQQRWQKGEDLLGSSESATSTPHHSSQAAKQPTSAQEASNRAHQILDVSGQPVKEALPETQAAAAPLARVNISDACLEGLHSSEAAVRRQAIWELGQRGTSEAVPALVDTLINADSKERSLILAAISEIGIRTLKPMHQALALSLQDENPEVRKNAIRDLTRVYDLMGQLSPVLSRATQDPDREVQETAQWALEQLGRMRQLAGSAYPIGPEAQGPFWSEEASHSRSS